MYRAAIKVLQSKYLNFSIKYFNFPNNFRESYCHTLEGELDNSRIQMRQMKIIANTIYYQMTGIDKPHSREVSLIEALGEAFEITGFSKC